MTQKEAFLKCKKEGRSFVVEYISEERIKATLAISESDLASANFLKINLDQKSIQWNTVYKLYYDALHELAEALLRFKKIKIDNHQCLFVYLSQRTPN